MFGYRLGWGSRVLRYLFMDVNSYFASVEQEERGLSGPIGIVPMAGVGTTCIIAASYEAKAWGVNTGTAVHDARKLCPAIRLIEARPDLYVQYHHRIIDALESCIHVDHVASIDEMYGRLMGDECDPGRAASIAFDVKAAVRAKVGPRIRVSIGMAPNAWLAKVASDMTKPDGMTMILAEQMPEALYRLKLTDLPGIASSMASRLARFGVRHVYQLCAMSEAALSAAWGSKVHGAIWYRQLRGADLPYRPTTRRQFGHSHVLAPEYRSDEKARAVLARMIHKAAARMRRTGYSASRMTVFVEHLGGVPTWERSASLGLCRDTLVMVSALAVLWPLRPRAKPFKVGVVLSQLVADKSAELPMYPDQVRRNALADAMDRINRRFGRDAVYPAAMLGAEKAAPTRISFTQIPQLEEF